MSEQATAKTKAPSRSRIGELKALRDDIRLNVHVAGMDLRDEWHALEKRLPDPAQQLKEVTADVVDRLVTELQRFRTRLGDHGQARSVERLMSHSPATCRPWDSLAAAVSTMWDCDVGLLPVVDDAGTLVGLVTDRDACMAAFTRGLRMDDLQVETVMSRDVSSCRAEDTVEAAQHLMKAKRVRRLPVVTEDGKLVGVITINDLARAALAGTEPSGRAGGLFQTVATLVGITASRTSDDGAPAA
jgi:CBS domain-containing protein